MGLRVGGITVRIKDQAWDGLIVPIISIIGVGVLARATLAFSEGEVDAFVPEFRKCPPKVFDIPAHEVQCLRAFGENVYDNPYVGCAEGHPHAPQLGWVEGNLDRPLRLARQRFRQLPADMQWHFRTMRRLSRSGLSW